MDFLVDKEDCAKAFTYLNSFITLTPSVRCIVEMTVDRGTKNSDLLHCCQMISYLKRITTLQKICLLWV